jgi:hypothetical protein
VDFTEICCRWCSGAAAKGQPQGDVFYPFTTDEYGAVTIWGQIRTIETFL